MQNNPVTRLIMKKSSLSYAQLQRTLSTTQSSFQAAQVHGLLCGLLCGDEQVAPPFDEFILSKKKNSSAQQALQKLYKKSAKQLSEFSFGFQLLLPTDKQDLRLRSEALGLWCQGFLTGLKLTHIPVTQRAPSDITDALNDIIEIAQISFEATDESEENEHAYVELVEYVRLAILMIYQELRNAP